jgi:hypothetical protein
VLNSTQQIGGSLGTSLLNTFYASAVSSYVVAHHLSPAFNPPAAIHGYHVAFWIGVGLIAAAFVAVLVLVNAGKADIPTQPGVPAGA